VISKLHTEKDLEKISLALNRPLALYPSLGPTPCTQRPRWLMVLPETQTIHKGICASPDESKEVFSRDQRVISDRNAEVLVLG